MNVWLILQSKSEVRGTEPLDLSLINPAASKLTASEAGSQVGDLELLDDEETSKSPLLITKKHFSRNQRLHDANTV